MLTDFQSFFKLIGKKDEALALTALEDRPDWALRPQTLLEACFRSKALLVERALTLGADPNVRSRPTPGAWRIPLGRGVEAHDGRGRWTDGSRQPGGRLAA